MKDMARFRIPTLRPAVVGLLMLALFGVLLLTQLVGPARERRDRGIEVMRSEAAALRPPFADSQLTRKVERNEPFGVLILEEDYSLSAPCADLQTYYSSRTAAAGWSLVEPVQTIHEQSSTPPRDLLESSYRKNVAGYAINLSIECFIDQSQGQGYTLSMTSS